jgi:hypothetical protein
VALYEHFIALFKTSLLVAPIKAYNGDVTVEFFPGSRTFVTLPQVTAVVPMDDPLRPITQPSQIETDPDSFHILLDVRVKGLGGLEVEAHCNRLLDNAIGLLSVALTSEVFDALEYRGWIKTSDETPFTAWLHPADRPQYDNNALVAFLAAPPWNPRVDDADVRFGLMSRFHASAIPLAPSPERLILEWTALEVFPMENTTNIGPIAQLVGDLTGLPTELVKRRLRIGQAYGARCDLVHEGTFPAEQRALSRLFTTIDICVHVAMRYLAGLPYNGIADQFLAQDDWPTEPPLDMGPGITLVSGADDLGPRGDGALRPPAT